MCFQVFCGIDIHIYKDEINIVMFVLLDCYHISLPAKRTESRQEARGWYQEKGR